MENKLEINKNIIRVIKGSGFAVIISLILLLIYAGLLTGTSISETTMTPVVITISGISILIGSSISSFKIKKRNVKWCSCRINLYYCNLFVL